MIAEFKPQAETLGKSVFDADLKGIMAHGPYNVGLRAAGRPMGILPWVLQSFF